MSAIALPLCTRNSYHRPWLDFLFIEVFDQRSADASVGEVQFCHCGLFPFSQSKIKNVLSSCALTHQSGQMLPTAQTVEAGRREKGDDGKVEK